MSPTPHDLRTVQRWMHAIVTHPDGVVAGIASSGARHLIDLTSSDVEEVIARSASQGSIERLEVYRNAYFARLLGVLRDEFPALAFAVGQETFEAFCVGYLQAYPSRSYTLAALGDRFPQYLAETRPPRPDGAAAPDWPDFLIELARLERTYSEVFDGPGVEGRPALRTDDLLAIPPNRWPQARLVPVPCLRLLTFQFPVHEYATCVRRTRKATPPGAGPTWLAVTRRDYVVRRRPLTRQQFELLTLLTGGDTVGQSLRKLSESMAQDLGEDFPARLRCWFRDWTAEPFFQSVALPMPPRDASGRPAR